MGRRIIFFFFSKIMTCYFRGHQSAQQQQQQQQLLLLDPADFLKRFHEFSSSSSSSLSRAVCVRRRRGLRIHSLFALYIILHYTLKTSTIENVQPLPFQKKKLINKQNEAWIWVSQFLICLSNDTFSTVNVFNV